MTIDWEGMYGELLHSLQPGVGYPAGYDYVAEHEANIVKAREQAQVDVTLERDAMRAELLSQTGKAGARQRMLRAGIALEDIEELEK